MTDYLTTRKPDDSPALRALRVDLALLRMGAARIEERAAARRAARAPALIGSRDWTRARNRDYDAVRRAKELRRRAALIVARIEELENAARAAALLV